MLQRIFLPRLSRPHPLHRSIAWPGPGLGLLLALLLCLPVPPVHSGQPPFVVASIPPVHSLVAGVMEGVATPVLLIRGGATVHAYRLRPSQMRTLNRAQAIFRIGSNLESFLDRPLASLTGKSRIVDLMEWPGMHLLPGRHGGLWQHTSHHREHGYLDPHIWLDPRNAEIMVEAIVTTLADIDPPHTRHYQDNGSRLRTALRRLDRELATRLAPVRTLPYLVFHDAYHYFENRYGLHAVGAVTATPDRPPGARRLREVKRLIQQGKIRCLFREPQFTPGWLDMLREGTSLYVGVLDPLGAELEPGPDLYFTLMRRLAASLTDCLSKTE